MVVDDEPIARDIIISHIANTPGLILVKSCMNASEAYEGLYQHPVDLIFLDIQMPVITGVDFLRSLRNPPLVVFTTAYEHYAIEGFELNSVDYLLKPITYDRFHQAMQKINDRFAYKNSLVIPPTPIVPQVDYIFIKMDTKLVRVNHEQINYIQAEKDYSSVYLDNKRLFASMHLKLFEELLPKDRFLRVHRSFLVNLSKIKTIQGNMIELEGKELPIGANYKEELFRTLGIA
ncbi:LytTR family two component transcriptional regulator [Chitinophaga skermanii]|uniref:LytTR family two component transcriptional regulator n=2 Tax=Chitinophaga skermanii TaxID=331697 RepID=A0A327QUS5_9BACT|nr:LytTR family two component transcriptional regulator [Chitinophaga skermanii]